MKYKGTDVYTNSAQAKAWTVLNLPRQSEMMKLIVNYIKQQVPLFGWRLGLSPLEECRIRRTFQIDGINVQLSGFFEQYKQVPSS